MKHQSFYLNSNNVVVESTGDLNKFESAAAIVYGNGFELVQLEQIAACATVEQVINWFSINKKTRFYAFVELKKAGIFLAFNDPFGCNEIYVTADTAGIRVSSKLNPEESVAYNRAALYEFISCQSVLAPRTILQGVEAVPIAQCVVIDIKNLSYEYKSYWDITDLLTKKAADYNDLTVELREAFRAEILSVKTKNPSVALSGGIDSGCILGILHDAYQKDIPSVSYGPYGKYSDDLESSRITAAYFESTNTELYPDQKMFTDIISVSKELSVPISGEILMANIQLLGVAKKSGSDTMFFGYGTQMMLGNLGLNQLWHKVWWFEAVVPNFIRNFVYKSFLKLNSSSGNGVNVLLSNSWAERFVYKAAPLLSRERFVFKDLPSDFVSNLSGQLDNLSSNKKMCLSDKLVLWYFSTWTNYGQGRNAAAIGRIIGMEVALPYNAPSVGSVLCKTPDAFRKKNKWNKQLWRDAIKPYIPEHLYNRKGKSLTIRYDKILLPHKEEIIEYLEKNELIQEIIDINKLRICAHKLPEPGLMLLRLMTLALWHDVRAGTGREELLDKLFKKFIFE